MTRVLFQPLLLALVALLLGTQLQGCATSAAKETADSASIVTAAEETDARKRARLRLELAVGYFDQGQTTVALEELRQTIALDPTLAEAYNLRGLIAMRLGDTRLAEESFQRALQLRPREPDTSHNMAWLLCSQGRYVEANGYFEQALASPIYTHKPKTHMAQGLCEMKAGKLAEAEQHLLKSYEFDAGHPVTGYNLAELMYRRGDYTRAQFYIRRLNNGEFANAESLWLGIRVERRLGARDAMQQLGATLRKNFPNSTQLAAYERGEFND